MVDSVTTMQVHPVSLSGAYLTLPKDEYVITIDGDRTSGSGFRPPPDNADNFQQSLFNKSGLDAGLHEAVLTDFSNKPSNESWLDIDWGVITLGDGDTT